MKLSDSVLYYPDKNTPPRAAIVTEVAPDGKTVSLAVFPPRCPNMVLKMDVPAADWEFPEKGDFCTLRRAQ